MWAGCRLAGCQSPAWAPYDVTARTDIGLFVELLLFAALVCALAVTPLARSLFAAAPASAAELGTSSDGRGETAAQAAPRQGPQDHRPSRELSKASFAEPADVSGSASAKDVLQPVDLDASARVSQADNPASVHSLDLMKPEMQLEQLAPKSLVLQGQLLPICLSGLSKQVCCPISCGIAVCLILCHWP